jgi:uncharacterized SAM-binding protein YcdF (DUF218 family)
MKLSRRVHRFTVVRAAFIVIVVLAVWVVLAWGAASFLIVQAELPLADALVVLSSGSTYIERTNRAAQLWQEGRGTMIVVMNDGLQGGWSQSEQRTPFYFERAIGELRRQGVAAESIRLLPDVVPGGTYGEAVHVRQYVRTHGLRSVLVVTSAYHSRRTLWTFQRVFDGSGVAVGVAPAAPGQQTPPRATWWLYPSGWRIVLGEYVKGIYYLARYGLSVG